jgi:predicted Zn-dependent protease
MLPKRIAESLARGARPGRADDAIKAAEQLVRARDDGRSADARKAAVKAKQAAPRSAWVREQLGLFAFELGDLHEAAQELLAYRRFTGDRRHDAIIAECYRQQGKPERALELIADLDRSTIPARAWIESQIVRARALVDTGRPDAARTLLTAAARGASTADLERLREVARDL